MPEGVEEMEVSGGPGTTEKTYPGGFRRLLRGGGERCREEAEDEGDNECGSSTHRRAYQGFSVARRRGETAGNKARKIAVPCSSLGKTTPKAQSARAAMAKKSLRYPPTK